MSALSSGKEIAKHRFVQDKYETVVRTAMDGFWLVDMRGHFLDANDSYCELIGYTRDELLKMSITDVEAAETASETAEHIQRIIKSGHDRFETRHRRKDGRVVDIEVSVNFTELEGGRLFVFLRDITERKKTEAALKESEERFRIMADSSPLMIWVTGPDGAVQFVNRAYRDFSGVTLDFVVGNDWQRRVHPDDGWSFIGEFLKAAREHQPFRGEARIMRTDGEWRWIESYGVPRLSPSGEFMGMVGSSHDITERKVLEEELNSYRQRLEEVIALRTSEFARTSEELSESIEEHKKAEDKLLLKAAILDKAMEAIFLVNPRGDLYYANEAAVEIYGYTHLELVSMNVRQLVRPEDAPAIGSRLEMALKTGRFELKTWHVRKDKSVFPVQIRHSAIKTPQGDFIISVAHDIS